MPKERRVLRPKSHRRYAEACNRTVLLPHYGFGKLQSKAAPSAQSNLGIPPSPNFYMGTNTQTKGVLQDYSEAMTLFQRASEQGHPVAKLCLGVMYAEGRGVPQDYVRVLCSCPHVVQSSGGTG